MEELESGQRLAGVEEDGDDGDGDDVDDDDADDGDGIAQKSGGTGGSGSLQPVRTEGTG